MSIMMGNLSIDKIENRLNIKFPEELKRIMNDTRQENVSIKIKEGCWHCFDIPFTLFCGNKQFAATITGYLKPLADQMKCSINIAWQ